MTVYKKHTRPDNTSGVCEATIEDCPFGSNGANHFYYDSTIKKEVLNPDSSTQKNLDRLSVEELHTNSTGIVGEEASNDNYQSAYADYVAADADYNERKAKVIASYPEVKQDFVKQLIDTPMGPSLIGSMEIYDAPTRKTIKSSASEDERVKFATSWLKRSKAENKFRATVSSMLV
jgi:hypothetical protein